MRDKEIITRYNINKSARVLDVGGSMKQREMIVVDTLVDMPFVVQIYKKSVKE